MFLNSFQIQGNFESRGSTADTITTQTMTVDDLSSTYTAEESLAVIYQRDATGRRCHKTLKGGGEAVWPPNLEAALITGLEVYSDRHRVHMRHRGRFIGRNHFLSDYVKSTTGRRRTAKQVGSRLQQLKDTCRELDILYLITGSRSPSLRRYQRRGRKSGSKSSSRRSVSSSPALSDETVEEPLEERVRPQSYEQDQSSPQYMSPIEAPQQITYSVTVAATASAVPVAPTLPTYEPPAQCSYANDQCATPHYYGTSPQYYHSQDWSGVAQSSSFTYPTSQQWSNYYSPVEIQQPYAYYNTQCY